MAWIQVHQQLKDHRKLLAAADELEIEPPHMLGLLTSFWLWALDNAPSGSLEGISNRNIARAIYSIFKRKLISCTKIH